MGTATNVEVGIEPGKQERYAQLQQDAKELGKKIEMIRPVLINYTQKLKAGISLPADKIAFMKTQVSALKTLQGQLAPINEEMNTLRLEFMTAGRAKVEVQNMIYPGVTIKISEQSLTTKEERKYCQFVVADGEVKAKNL